MRVGKPIVQKMSFAKVKMRPLRFRQAQKKEVRSQFAALCYRVKNDKVQVLLVTSRGTGRWILPKGWPMDGVTPTDAAMQEAWEEAGVEGKVIGNSIGIYSYDKDEDGTVWPCIVAVFPIKVRQLAKDYPEAKERRRKWLSPKKAAALLHEPELRQIVSAFDPAVLRK